MAYERLARRRLDYRPCRYEGSKLGFRGPARALRGVYVACLGGTETYGLFIEQPFPVLLERALGVACVNLGCRNAGLDAFLGDRALAGAMQGARAVVLQLPGALNMTNRFYRVHPRRNDRFLAPTPALRALYGEVDFTEFHFTRHLAARLRDTGPQPYARFCSGLRSDWLLRMRRGLAAAGGVPVVLLWISRRAPDTRADSPELAMDPALITRPMIEALRDRVAAVVEVVLSPEARAQGTGGMVFDELERAAAERLPGPLSHRQVSAALAPVLRGILEA